MIELKTSLKVGNELGEGVIWDHAGQKIWWTDIQQSKLYRYDTVSEELNNWSTPERLACFAPVQGHAGLVAAFASGFAFYDPETGTLEWIHKLENDNPGTRFNDGRTDRQGRLWSGTMVEDAQSATQNGSLYCLNHDLTITRSLTDLLIPNSLCWSPDGETVYHTDTPKRCINRHSYNIQTAQFGEPELLVKTQRECYPDGSIVDAQGYLWNAQWGASQVVRYSPSGEQDLVLKVPTSQPTCVAFGGEDLDLLIVTSAYQDMPKREDEAGDLFIYQTDFKGLIESPFIVRP
ncbi:MAG: L-arabinonolactonase [Cryomorphaceae bacterium]|jgi:L-arabinonolactonase